MSTESAPSRSYKEVLNEFRTNPETADYAKELSNRKKRLTRKNYLSQLPNVAFGLELIGFAASESTMYAVEPKLILTAAVAFTASVLTSPLYRRRNEKLINDLENKEFEQVLKLTNSQLNTKSGHFC